ncbi:MAG: sel1 repeat family protein [Clostridia bacterium]|nr:sel1 repeat family protein [Clostridia bacterium]
MKGFIGFEGADFIVGSEMTAKECSDLVNSYIDCADGDKTGIMKSEYLRKAVSWTNKLRELVVNDYVFVVNNGPDSSAGQEKLHSLVKLGLPEAVLLYVCTDVQENTDIEKYTDYIRLLEKALKAGFPDEDMSATAMLLLGAVCLEYGKYLKGRERLQEAKRLWIRALELGDENAQKLLDTLKPEIIDLDYFTYIPETGTSLTDEDHDDLNAIGKDFEKYGVLPFGFTDYSDI